MSFLLLIAALLLFAAAIATVIAWWLLLAVPVVRAIQQKRPLPGIRFALLQASLVLLLAETLLVPTQHGAFLFPPLGIFWYSGVAADHWQLFLIPMALGALSAFTLSRALARYSPQFWIVAPAAATATFCAVTLLAASIVSSRAQAAAATALQPDCFHTGNFFKSLRIARLEYQFDYHSLAFKDEQAFGWSFSRMGFYPIKPNTVINLHGALSAFEQCYGKPLERTDID